MTDPRPLIAHVVYRFETGGLENGLVNIVNRLPRERFRHVVIALTTCDAGFCKRIVHDDVRFVALRKPAGHAFRLYPRLLELFREIRPAVLHTRNLAALEVVAPARMAGVPIRIHGEHGWDVGDPDGRSIRYRLVRRFYRPFVTHYVALSGHLATYLTRHVGVRPERITRIVNGVDAVRFRPRTGDREAFAGSPFNASGLCVIGTVGRLQAIKDQRNLVHAFARLRAARPREAPRLRLMIVGDGPLREALEAEVAALGLRDTTWFAGERGDVPEAMRALDVFVLPSRAEGISNTILEAMASGRPVVATDVGGNGELVVPGETGALVRAADPAALADALVPYVSEPARADAHGRAGRRRAEARFSIDAMVAQYANLYETQLRCAGWREDADPVAL